MGGWKKHVAYIYTRRKEFLLTLGLDSVAWLVIAVALSKMAAMLKFKARNLLGTSSLEDIQQQLFLQGPGYARGFEQGLGDLVTALIAVILVSIVGFILISAVKNKFMWQIIEDKKVSFSKWLGILFATPIVFVVFCIVWAILRFIVVAIVQNINLRFVQLADVVVLIVIAAAVYLVLSLWFMNLSRQNRIFASLGTTAKWLYNNKARSTIFVLLTMLGFLLIQFIIVVSVGESYLYINQAINNILNGVLWIIFVSWVRFSSLYLDIGNH